MTKILSTSTRFLYAVMDSNTAKEAVDILAKAFVKEPTTRNSTFGRTFTEQHWKHFINLYVPDTLERELTVVCIEKTSGRVAGAFLGCDFLTPDPMGQDRLIDGTQMEAELYAVHLIDEAFFRAFPQIDRHQAGLVCDLWMIGVHEDFQKLGIAKRLCTELTKLVKQKGYKYAIMECTGAYSQAMARKCGYESVYALPYTKFVYKGRNDLYSKVPKPHRQWEIFVQELQKTDEGKVRRNLPQKSRNGSRVFAAKPSQGTVDSEDPSSPSHRCASF